MRAFLHLLLLLLFQTGFSNHLQIRNSALAGEKQIQFEIAWENAWNLQEAPANHDAVWVFVKYKDPQGLWQHLDLSTVQSDFSAASQQIEIQPVADGKGVFVVPAQQGVYSVNFTQITLTASHIPEHASEFQVFGIEMVYVPQGAFFLGDTTSINSLALNNQPPQPFLVDSENTIELGNQTGQLNLINPNAMFPPDFPQGTLSEAFPKGYEAFYCMKYEISQQQYCDFLNSLSFEAQARRTTQSPESPTNTFAMLGDWHNTQIAAAPHHADSIGKRNSIVVQTPGQNNAVPAVYACNLNTSNAPNSPDDGQNIAANWLNWADLAAYLDWAALRPLSELEFEKLCRGANQTPLPGEFAWGTAAVTDADSVQNQGTAHEIAIDIILPGSGLANHGNQVASGYLGFNAPLRCGFAAKNNTTRLDAGAAFYGAFELSGNLWEQVAGVVSQGLNFEKHTGDGNIAPNGDADVPTWPDNQTAQGIVLKGGAWQSTISKPGSYRDLAVSDRFYVHLTPGTRRATTGGRGAR